jgi:pimeloyl-ACP methyl ester carboxylesterase
MVSRGDGGRRPLGYEDRGRGAPLVLLHPFPLTRLIWAGLADVLATRRRVISVDAPGFGESPAAGDGAFSIADFADDVAALLGELKIDQATVLGMSMGGYAALAFAARHGQRLSGLILADTRAAADDGAALAGRKAALELILRDGPVAYLTASLPRLLSPGAPPALAAHLRARSETRAASLIAAIGALRDRPDRSAELAAIRCPTLVVCGEADQVTPAAEMRGIAGAIPGASFAPIADAGHLSHVEAPGAFERVVSRFLEGHAP